MVDTYVVMESEPSCQAKSKNDFQLALELIYRRVWHCGAQHFENAVHCNVKLSVVPIARNYTPQQLLDLRRTCLWHYRNRDAGYGSITSRETDSDTKCKHFRNLA
jgi:phage-related protein